MASLDYETAQTAQRFHHADDCAQGVTIGPRGGIAYPRTEEWRRNGATKTWKTRPGEYRIPIKYGLRTYWDITDRTAEGWHIGTAAECPDGRLADDIATLAEGYTARLDMLP